MSIDSGYRYEYIVYEKQEQEQEQVATITFNRPESWNALNTALLNELRTALEDAEADADIRVLVITGAGEKAFSTGADIGEISDKIKRPEEARELVRSVQSILTLIERMQKPVIAKINGFCLGCGLELALACDLRITSDNSIFGLPEVNLALIPGGGGTQRLPRLIGKTKAMEMLMTGEQIDAAEALRWKLVNKAVPVDELDRTVTGLIKKLLAQSPVTLGILKNAVNRGIEMDLKHALQYEAECFEAALKTKDAQERVRAFLDKKKS
ncbi:MAG: enoyl-CoA hydratase [Methanophagales archaeon]|nr:enoyl-CoA hydratase [Methanophagales archaeon]